MKIRIARGRRWIGLAYLAVFLLGTMPGAGRAQLLGVNINTPNCIAQTAAPNLGLLPSQQWAGTYQRTCGDMLSSHAGGIVVSLGNSTVLVIGGLVPLFGNDPTLTRGSSKVELYDESLGVFLPASDVLSDLGDEHALLGNGQVLFVFGGLFDGVSPDVSQIYQPALLSFSYVGRLVKPRYYGSFSLNAVGSEQALLVGGYTPAGVMAEAELYQANSRSYVTTGSLNTARAYASSVALRDGRILIAGGFTALTSIGFPTAATARAEIYNPATGTFTPTGSMVTARAAAYSVLLNDGRVLFVAGATCYSSTGCQLSSAEIYDPASGRFSPTGGLQRALPGCCGWQPFLMKNGKVLLGDEIYDPARGTFSLAPGVMPPVNSYHSYYSPVLLGTGQVLWLGAWQSTAAWLYQPPP